jgi:hypothetical protein
LLHEAVNGVMTPRDLLIGEDRIIGSLPHEKFLLSQ